MKKNSAFQYFNGGTMVCDKTGLTLNEAKSLWNEYHSDMMEKTKDGEDIEVAIWINMKDNNDYTETLVHLHAPCVDEHGLWENQLRGRQFYGKYNLTR